MKKCSQCGGRIPKRRLDNGLALNISVKYCSDVCRLRFNNAAAYRRRRKSSYDERRKQNMSGTNKA